MDWLTVALCFWLPATAGNPQEAYWCRVNTDNVRCCYIQGEEEPALMTKRNCAHLVRKHGGSMQRAPKDGSECPEEIIVAPQVPEHVPWTNHPKY